MSIVSVIVPVYKVEPYLRRCVDSLLSQTFSDLEVILVDDGSPDNCGAICDEYAAQDARVHVIHQANGGLSAARNAGIDWAFQNSDSRWLAFVDSDDWVHPQYLELLYRAATENGVSVSICSFCRTGEVAAFPEVPYEPRTSVWESLFIERDCECVIACNKLYARELFRELRYPVGKLHEDEFLTYKILYLARDVVYLPAALYYYFENSSGITGQPFTEKRLDGLDALRERIAFAMQNTSKAFQDYSIRTFVEFCRYYYQRIKNSPQIEAPVRRRRLRELRHEARRILVQYGASHVPVRKNKKLYAFAFPTAARLIKGPRKIGRAIQPLRRFFERLCLRIRYPLRVMSREKTIAFIQKNHCSIARYGDGEFNLIGGSDISFQKASEALSEALLQALRSSDEKLLLCIPGAMFRQKGFKREAVQFWKYWLNKNGRTVFPLLWRTAGRSCIFGDAMITRPYADLKSADHAKKHFSEIMKLWEGRDILVVEGAQTHLGVGNDLLDRAKTIRRVECPAENAFSARDQILDAVSGAYRGDLVLIALGPTATVLAYDLSRMGIQALDIGHLDIEYEWYLRHAEEKIAIPGKYVNEAKGGRSPEKLSLEQQYLDQVIARIEGPDAEDNT